MKKIARVLTLVLATIILFFLLINAFVWWHLRPITSVSKYQHVKKGRWHNPKLVEHFPDTIPSSARHIEFYYRPGFLQGGSTIELRIQMPENLVEDIYTTYRPRAKSVFGGAERLDRSASNPNMLRKWTFYTFQEDQFETTDEMSLLPPDFEILLLSSRPYKTSPVDWNHGDCSGISVSRKRREVIYWAEAW